MSVASDLPLHRPDGGAVCVHCEDVPGQGASPPTVFSPETLPGTVSGGGSLTFGVSSVQHPSSPASDPAFLPSSQTKQTLGAGASCRAGVHGWLAVPPTRGIMCLFLRKTDSVNLT